MGDKEQVTILIAEDDAGHFRLMQNGFKGAGLATPVIWFKGGQEAWDFLSGAVKPCLEPGKPYLLLLDIRMPGLDGVEVLRRVKADPLLKNIPVVMLSTADDPREIKRCYELGCAKYLTKTERFDSFAAEIKALCLIQARENIQPA